MPVLFRVQLPAALPIGFTGHRRISDEAASRRAIREVLEEQKRSQVALVYGVSSAAMGGDLLFAESCIELEIPLRILLPEAKEAFRNDFDEPAWQRAEAVFRKAMAVEVTAGGGAREDRYYHSSIETVSKSRMMIALWDGEPSHGKGGTGDTVAFAEQLGKPLIWIHSATGAVKKINESAFAKISEDAELEFLNGLPDDEETLSGNSSRELAEAWFRKIDGAATRFAPQFRGLASVPICCTAVAAFLSGEAAHLPGPSAAMGATAALLPWFLRLKRRQQDWARARIAVEVCRSALALWDTPCDFAVVDPEVMPELSGVMMALNFQKMLDPGRRKVSLEDFKKKYRSGRLEHQIGYFDTHMKRAARRARFFQITQWLCAGLAVAISAWLYVARSRWFGWHLSAGPGWIALAAAAFFQIATVVGALVIISDSIRRRSRYLQMRDWLIAFGRQMDAVRTWPTVLAVVDRIEKLLLVELIEWKSLTQHSELPRR